MAQIFFYILAGITIFAAAEVIVTKHNLDSVLWFGLFTVSAASLCALLGAVFIAVVHIILFGIGICLLYMVGSRFLPPFDTLPLLNAQWLPSIIVLCVSGYAMIAVTFSRFPRVFLLETVPDISLTHLAVLLFSKNFLLVVLMAMVLMISLCGSVLLIKERKK